MLIVSADIAVLANVSDPNEKGKIVITQVDEDAIKSALEEYNREYSRNINRFSSSIPP